MQPNLRLSSGIFAAFICHFFGVITTLNTAIYALQHQLYPITMSDPPIVIIGVDDYSFRKYKENDTWGRSWPWSPRWFADVIQVCRQKGARVVALDRLFSEPSPYNIQESQDREEQILADAMRSIPCVMGSMLTEEYLTLGVQLRETRPMDILAKVSRIGILNTPRDLDNVVRRTYLKYYDQYSFAVEITSAYQGITPSELLHQCGLDDTQGEITSYIPYSHPPIPVFSFYDVHTNNLSEKQSALLHNAIVIIGVNDVSLQDIHPVPVEEGIMSGVEIQGQIVRSLHNRIVWMNPPFARILVILLIIISFSSSIFTWISRRPLRYLVWAEGKTSGK